MSTGRVRRVVVLLGVVVGVAVAAVAVSAAATAYSLDDKPGVSIGDDPIVIVTPPDSATPQPIDDTPLAPSPMPTPDVSTAPDDNDSSTKIDAPGAVIVDDHGGDRPDDDSDDSSGSGDDSSGSGSGGSGGSGD